MVKDKYRDRLLNDKLKRFYDVLLSQSSQYIPENKLNSFKNQLVKNINGSFRYGQSQVKIQKL